MLKKYAVNMQTGRKTHACAQCAQPRVETRMQLIIMVMATLLLVSS